MPLTTRSAFGFERVWLSRALSVIEREPEVFAPARLHEATALLGLGTRKVGALKFWLRHLGLVKFEDNQARATPLGQIVGNYDPGFDEVGTWWTLHYRLSVDPEGATAYWWVTNHLRKQAFSVADIAEGLRGSFQDGTQRTLRDAASMVFAVIRHTPLSGEVGCYQAVGDERFARCVPTINSIPLGTLGYAVTDWAVMDQRTTVNIEELLLPGAPGRIYNLTRAVLDACVDRVHNSYRGQVLAISRTAGLNSLAINREIHPLQVLEAYYLAQVKGLAPDEALRESIQHGLATPLLAQEAED